MKIGGREVPLWDGRPVSAIVCVRLDQALTAAPGSSIEHCHDCQAEVWFAESSLQVLEKYPTTPVICMRCVTKRVEQNVQPMRVDDEWLRGMQT